MNNDYIEYKKQIDDLTEVLSFGYKLEYSTKVIEKRIINSKYFDLFLNDDEKYFEYLSTIDVVKEIYFETNVRENILNNFYDELEWVATAYVYIIKNTILNFETVFLYLPIKTAVEMYGIYHELDLNKVLKWFNEQREMKSIIKIRSKHMNLTSKEISEKTGMSISMVNALKNRKRDIKKLELNFSIK